VKSTDTAHKVYDIGVCANCNVADNDTLAGRESQMDRGVNSTKYSILFLLMLLKMIYYDHTYNLNVHVSNKKFKFGIAKAFMIHILLGGKFYLYKTFIILDVVYTLLYFVISNRMYVLSYIIFFL
jgi:hypothetical protein